MKIAPPQTPETDEQPIDLNAIPPDEWDVHLYADVLIPIGVQIYGPADVPAAEDFLDRHYGTDRRPDLALSIIPRSIGGWRASLIEAN